MIFLPILNRKTNKKTPPISRLTAYSGVLYIQLQSKHNVHYFVEIFARNTVCNETAVDFIAQLIAVERLHIIKIVILNIRNTAGSADVSEVGE